MSGSLRHVFLLALLLAGRPAQAQLISPGKLSTPHAQLEGLGNCTKCHDLGKPGASDAKCLSCHDALKARVARKEGFHATLTGKACASCHKEHFGTDFAVVRIDTATFDHGKTGFELKLGHRKVACRDCHTDALIVDPAVRAYATAHKSLGRTFLGLATGCLDCHRQDDPHAGQFGTRTCTACHDEATWKKAPLFDHDSAKFVLTGKHRTTTCAKCHKPATMAGAAKPVAKFVGLTASSCTSCHTDPHRGGMKQACESCHSTESWARLLDRTRFEATFDHRRTKFILTGIHAKAACARCHTPTARPTATVRLTFPAEELQAMYPAPRATGCLSCHVDVHEGTFAKSAGGPVCQNCHGETAWLPTSYDLARHNRETFALTGAHIAVPCAACHPPVRAAGPPRFRLASRACLDCHRKSDPHAGQFAQRACSECHVADSFEIPAFNHAKTRYALDGAHQTVACAKCHTKVTPKGGAAFTRYRPLPTTCRACHGAEPTRPS